MYRDQLILILIQNDATHAFLEDKAEALGLDVQDYCLSLGRLILGLLGFANDLESEPVYEKYIEMRSTISREQLKDEKEKLKFAADIFIFLKKELKILESKKVK